MTGQEEPLLALRLASPCTFHHIVPIISSFFLVSFPFFFGELIVIIVTVARSPIQLSLSSVVTFFIMIFLTHYLY
jgi:hypothetical protein